MRSSGDRIGTVLVRKRTDAVGDDAYYESTYRGAA